MVKQISLIRLVSAGISILSLFAFVFVIKSQLSNPSFFDDAHMFLRYAKHWLAGFGFSWNTGEGPVYGITSFTHLLLLTAVRGVTKLSDILVLTSVSFFCGLAAVGTMAFAGFAFFSHLRKFWMPLLIIPCMVLAPLYARHSTTGMETTLALFFNSVLCIAVLYHAGKRSVLSLILCLLSAYLTFLTRPDAGLYSILLAPLVLLADDRQNWKHALIFMGCFFLILGMDLFLKKAVFGDYLPLPFYSKSSGFYKGYLGGYRWNVWKEFFFFIREALPYILVLVCFTTRKSWKKVAAILIPMFLTFAYFSTVTQIMGMEARYYFPFLPFLILAAFTSAETFSKEISDGTPLNSFFIPLRLAVAISLLAVFSSSLAEGVTAYAWQRWRMEKVVPYKISTKFSVKATDKLPGLGKVDTIMRKMDLFLQKLPKGVLFAASEHGYIGSQNPELPILDIIGLHDRNVAYKGFSADYLFSKKPDIIWFPHQDYSYELMEIIDHKDFFRDYEYYPDAYDYGIAVAKNSAFYSRIIELLGSEFQQTYSGRLLSDYRAETEITQ